LKLITQKTIDNKNDNTTERLAVPNIYMFCFNYIITIYFVNDF